MKADDSSATQRVVVETPHLESAKEFENRRLGPTLQFISSLSRCKRWFKILSIE
jgi:hypothetical protein